MELVYLWVEEYKNIHKQGFNFSSQFICDYDEYKNELTIEDNPEHISDFFGENINVTAIVGKNGSGKTRIFKVIEDIWKRIGTINNNEYILCFYLDGEIYILTELEFIPKINCNYQQITDDIEIQDFFQNKHLLIGYSEIIHYSQEEYFYKDKENYEITFQESKIYEIISKIGYKKLSLTTFMMLPETLSLEIRKEEQENILKLITPIEKVSYHGGQELKYFDRDRFGNHVDVIRYYVDNNEGNLLEIYFVWKIIESGNLELFDNMSVPKNENDGYVEVLQLDHQKIINIVNKYNLNPEGYSFQEFNSLREKNSFSLINLSEAHSKLLKKYIKFFKFDYIDYKKCRYSELSQGEKIIYGQFLNILNFIENNNDVIVLLDEPSNSFHPQWQKQYITELTKSFKKNSIQFIITSHTPFLLSDIPKQNIIFLDKYQGNDEEVKNGIQKKENCKVVEGISQTFGANIHTLLSDSFFMEDGLMGEFAKGKINEIKNLYQLAQNKNVQIKLKESKSKELAKKSFCRRKKRLWQIESIIGEPFLQKVIKNYLDELELLFSDDNTLIEKELADIEERKVYLESLQNAKN